MKHILVLFQFSNQTNLMAEYHRNLLAEGIYVDVFDISKCQFVVPVSLKLSVYLMLVLWLCKYKQIRRIATRIFDKQKMVLNLVSYFDIIDIHFYSEFYHNLIPLFLEKGRKTKITIWGSDLYRSDRKLDFLRIKNFDLVDSINVATLQMKYDFIDRFGDFSNKISVMPFGVGGYNYIDKIVVGEYKAKYIPEIYKEKKVLICGYNGSNGQQHELMIKALDEMPIDIKNQLFVIVPMTYGANLKYVHDIDKLLQTIGIPYKILFKYLSNVCIAELRVVSDIVLNVQVTDAFSGSLQEHLYAGNILIIAEWLKYSTLDENEVFYLKTAKNNIAEMIEYSVVNFDKLKSLASSNKEKMNKISSWKSVRQLHANNYRSML